LTLAVLGNLLTGTITRACLACASCRKAGIPPGSGSVLPCTTPPPCVDREASATCIALIIVFRQDELISVYSHRTAVSSMASARRCGPCIAINGQGVLAIRTEQPDGSVHAKDPAR